MDINSDNGPNSALLAGDSVFRAAKRLVLATRPAFFPASVLPVVLGTAWGARAAGSLDAVAAVLALGATVLVHAGANVVNDVWDDLSGTDAANTNRIYPFTGGSRFIQAGILSRAAMERWGYLLLAFAAVTGMALSLLKGPVVIALGVIGAVLGIAYSAAPVRLASRGLGETTVAIAFGVLPVTGAVWLQSGSFGGDAMLLAMPVSLWVFNILLINEIPDIEADRMAGKRTLPVRIGVRAAAWVFAATNLVAFAAVGFAITLGLLPALAIAVPALAVTAALVLASRLGGRTLGRSFLTTAIKTTLAIHTAGALWLTVLVWP